MPSCFEIQEIKKAYDFINRQLNPFFEVSNASMYSTWKLIYLSFLNTEITAYVETT